MLRKKRKLKNTWMLNDSKLFLSCCVVFPTWMDVHVNFPSRKSFFRRDLNAASFCVPCSCSPDSAVMVNTFIKCINHHQFSCLENSPALEMPVCMIYKCLSHLLCYIIGIQRRHASRLSYVLLVWFMMDSECKQLCWGLCGLSLCLSVFMTTLAWLFVSHRGFVFVAIWTAPTGCWLKSAH